MPQLAGAYYSELSSEMGTGTTRQDALQRLGWFAIYLDDDRVVLRALNADGLPTVVSKTLSAREFFAGYTPDIALYREKIMPLMESAREKLCGGGGDCSSLDNREKTVFQALQLDNEHLPSMSQEDRYKVALEMLADPPSFHALTVEHKQKLNVESIASRKDGNYDEAISLYGAMLRVTPGDDHIFFNVARVYYEKKEFTPCRNYLKLALEYEPGFEEASKFLKYLDQHAPQEQPDNRMHLRYRFFQQQPCTMTIGNDCHEAFVADLSAAGVQLRLPAGSSVSLKPGTEVQLAGATDVLRPLLPGNAGSVVWASKTNCGVALGNSLDTRSKAFRGIIAFSKLI